MAITDQVPEWLPEEIFSPRRFLSDEPLFLTERAGLWRVAVSLSRQIQSVNRQLSEALTLRQSASAVAKTTAQIAGPAGESSAADNVEPDALLKFASFSKYSLAEIRELLRLMRRWDLPEDSIVFTEASPGGSCFVILEGSIDVSTASRGQQQILATLNAGSVFGQMSLIDNVPRSATCSVRSKAVLLEIVRDPCEDLLRGGSPLALKFLATLNEGLILALRGADLRLMQLDRAEPISGPEQASTYRGTAGV